MRFRQCADRQKQFFERLHRINGRKRIQLVAHRLFGRGDLIGISPLRFNLHAGRVHGSGNVAVQKSSEGVLIALGLALAERRRSIGVINRFGNECMDGQSIVEREIGRSVYSPRKVLPVGTGTCFVQVPCDLHEPAALHFPFLFAFISAYFRCGMICAVYQMSNVV